MARIGETKCWTPGCSCTDAAVHRTSGGKLTIKCHKCTIDTWAPTPSGQRRIMALTTLDEDQAPAPAPAPGPAPAPAAPPKKSTFLFEL